MKKVIFISLMLLFTLIPISLEIHSDSLTFIPSEINAQPELDAQSELDFGADAPTPPGTTRDADGILRNDCGGS